MNGRESTGALVDRIIFLDFSLMESSLCIHLIRSMEDSLSKHDPFGL